MHYLTPEEYRRKKELKRKMLYLLIPVLGLAIALLTALLTQSL